MIFHVATFATWVAHSLQDSPKTQFELSLDKQDQVCELNPYQFLFVPKDFGLSSLCINTGRAELQKAGLKTSLKEQ